jgi:hypothetical protein
MQREVKFCRCILQLGFKSRHCMIKWGVKSMIVAEIFPASTCSGEIQFLAAKYSSEI